MTRVELRRVRDAGAVASAAADALVEAASRAVEERGRFTVALAGGTTPRRLYAMLGDRAGPHRARLRWDATHVFFEDERHVPPDHPDNNYGMVRDTLLARSRSPACTGCAESCRTPAPPPRRRRTGVDRRRGRTRARRAGPPLAPVERAVVGCGLDVRNSP